MNRVSDEVRDNRQMQGEDHITILLYDTNGKPYRSTAIPEDPGSSATPDSGQATHRLRISNKTKGRAAQQSLQDAEQQGGG